MKNWCKVFKLKNYHVVLLHLCNEEDGEHLQLMCRFPGGTFTRIVTFDDDEETAKEMFDQYEKKHAEKFIVEFEKLLEDESNKQAESGINA